MIQLSPIKRALLKIEELERQLADAHGFEPIAIIGIACRLPGGANSPQKFWDLLVEGRDAVTDVPDGRWDPELFYNADPHAPGKYLNRQAGFLAETVADFDARFFGISPIEAAALDPQQRLLLETSWEGWENAGIPVDRLKGSRTGVWIGISASDYSQASIKNGTTQQIGPYDITGAIGSTAAGRLSYFYDLRGPSMAIDTACSSSLVAIDLACAALHQGSCDLALTGGVSLMLTPFPNICFSKMQALSPDGRSKAFAASADGFGRGEGCGLLVLERLRDAERNGRNVTAVIRSTAVNQDGHSNGMTAPSVQAQIELLRTALQRARLRPADIGYLEAHGTGTPLGDPIEMEAIAEVYGQDRTEPLWVASAKSNIGHLETAAGVAGIIKAALALFHRRMPAHLHFHNPSPHIPWPEIPVRVPGQLTEWRSAAHARRAAVSSFGFSGTNAHAILEESPAGKESAQETDRWPNVLCLSAMDRGTLAQVSTRMHEWIESNPEIPVQEVCRSARVSRSHLPERLAIVANSREELLVQLKSQGSVIRGKAASRPRLLLAFTGQGSQYTGMAKELYGAEPIFRAAFDRCCAVFDQGGGAPLARIVFGDDNSGGLTVDDTQATQPAVFAVGYALAELLSFWGIVPEATLGHSVGEYVGACCAGVFSLEDACRLVLARANLMQSLPRNGGMAAVFADIETISASLRAFQGRVEIAAYNAPSSLTLSGERSALIDCLAELKKQNIRHKILTVSHAFHSYLMEPILDDFSREVAKVERRPPAKTLYSNVTGDTTADFTRVEYWVEHLRRPVRFADSVAKASAPGNIFIEAGPAPVLSSFGTQIDSTSCWVPMLRRNQSDLQQVCEALGQLYVRGCEIDWNKLGRPSRVLQLPNYPFDRQRYWKEPSPEERGEAFRDSQQEESAMQMTVEKNSLQKVVTDLDAILRANTGFQDVDASANLLELGVDSLMLMTTRQQIRDRFGVEIPISKFFEELSSLDRIAQFILQKADPQRLVPKEKPDDEVRPPAAVATAEPGSRLPLREAAAWPGDTGDVSSSPGAPAGMADIFSRQLHAVSQTIAAQLDALRYATGTPNSSSAAAAPSRASKTEAHSASLGIDLPPATESSKKPSSGTPEIFVPYKKIRAQEDSLAGRQQRRHVAELAERFCAVTAESKKLTQRYRSVFANNRNIAGFRPAWKEMVYQIVAESAAGSRIREAGGREFIDFTMGFGVHLFGHKPSFIHEAVLQAAGEGMPLGPMSHRAGPAAEKFCRMTGMERVAFYNTGSEAVMTALRIARTATGRDRIALFEGSYHGTFDGVLALRREENNRLYSAPGSPGTTSGMVQDVMVLRYDDPQSLELVRRHGRDLAAVLVEPVQSRRPDVRPQKFLLELRELTRESGTALIFDEMVSGFRCHTGGAQAHFGIRADLATYGKVIGGGLPIGLVAGKAEFMDAVDGGNWSFGDDSYPRKRNTFVAGTFCHHPLSLAAMMAVLNKLEQSGPALQEDLNKRTEALCLRLNNYFMENEAPIRVAHFSSLFRFFLRGDLELLFYHLIQRGIYVWEGRNCFLSTAHTDEDIEAFCNAVFASIEEMRRGGYLNPRSTIVATGPASSRLCEEAILAHNNRDTEIALNSSVRSDADSTSRSSATKPMQFSLFYFSSSSQAGADGYKLLTEGAKFADQRAFSAVWTPERHFHDFGGLYPNPVVTCAALSSITRNIRLRAGSTVILLHDPVRFAEDWAMVDGLSGGRADIALALGWNPNDFIFAPDRYENRRELLPEHLAQVRRLWRGEPLVRRGGKGESVSVQILPRPIQREIPIWLTAAGSVETFRLAGQLGANVLTYLEEQNLQELSQKIAIYRAERRCHSHLGEGHVTLMLHTLLGRNHKETLKIVDAPLREYLKSSLFLRTQMANTLGKHIDYVSDDELAPLLSRAAQTYIGSKSLIGTPETCRDIVEQVTEAGVDEIACLIDFGVGFDETMDGLESLHELKESVEKRARAGLSAAHPTTVPLSEEQQQLWFLVQQGRDASVAFNESVLVKLKGELLPEKLEAAWEMVADRHDAMRAVEIGERGQVFAKKAVVPIETVDFCSVPEERRGIAIQDYLSREAEREFDFTRGPLYRVTLLATATEEHLLLLTAHHLIADGWSLGLVLEEMATIYTSLVKGLPVTLPQPVGFRKYLEWQNEELKPGSPHESYWAGKLASPVSMTDLPADYSRAALGGWRGTRRSATVPESMLHALQGAARRFGVTLHMLLIGAWQILLSRLTGSTQVTTWIPIAGQIAMGAERLAGQCTRMFPVITGCDDAGTLGDVFGQVKKALVQIHEHRNVSFAGMKERGCKIHLPPATAMVNVDRAPGGLYFEGLEASLDATPIASAKHELSMNALEMPGKLVLDFDYRTELFAHETIVEWMEAYLCILRSAAAGEKSMVSEIEFGEQHLPPLTAPVGKGPILEPFERQVQLRPNHVAVKSAGRSRTFAELHQDAERIASALAYRGVRAGDHVGLESSDPVEAIAVKLAVMEIGAVWLEPAAFSIVGMMNLCDRAALILSRGMDLRMLPHGNVVDLDTLVENASLGSSAFRPSRPALEDTACTFHLDESSFSCSFAMLASQASAARSLFDLSKDDCVSVCGTPGLETIFACLTTGATLVFDEQYPNEGATVAVVPSWLAQHPAIGNPRCRVVVFTDGPVSAGAARRLVSSGAKIIEFCRPNGLPLVAAVGKLDTAGSDRRGVLCDRLLLPGKAVGSDGTLALYGSLAHWELEGTRGTCLTTTSVRTQGRQLLWMSDPLREVESVLRNIVADAVVVPHFKEDSEKADLVAYIVLLPDTSVQEIRSALATLLPAHLAPEGFVVLSALPPQFRRHPWMLAGPEDAIQAGLSHDPPQTENQRRMCELWAEVLDRSPVGINGRFIELGGQSLNAARLVNRIQDAFGLSVTLSDLLTLATPANLCRLIESRLAPERSMESKIEALPEQRDYELSRSQYRMWGMTQIRPEAIGYNIPIAAVMDGPLDVEALKSALEGMTLRHESLRTQFVERNGEPRQVIADVRAPLEEMDPSTDNAREAVVAAAVNLATAPFDLAKAPLWRARLLRFGGERYGLAMAFHHIIVDGWSIEVLARDLGCLYEEWLGKKTDLSKLPFQYRDYAAWENRRLSSSQDDLDWWVERLAGSTTLDLPCDSDRETAGLRVASMSVPISPAVALDFERLCSRRQVTKFAGLTAITLAFLHRLSGKADLLIGTPIARRENSLLEQQVGLYVNTVVLREHLDPKWTVSRLLDSVQSLCLDAFSRGTVPFDHVLDRLKPARHWGRSPLFDVVVALEEAPQELLHWGAVRLNVIEAPPVESLFDLNFRYCCRAGTYTLVVDYRADLFEEARIALWTGRLLRLMEHAVSAPKSAIRELDMTSAGEKQPSRRRVRKEIRL